MQGCIGEKVTAYKVLAKPEVKRPLKISCRVEDNTNVDIK
jgi:hypothetical protein